MQIVSLAKRKSGNWRGNWKSFGRSVFRTADGTFHHAVAPVLLLGQCISLLPVVNVFSVNFRSTRFKARSIRCAISLVYLLMAGLYSVLSIRWYIRRGLNMSYFANCIYMIVVYVSAIFFFLVAMRWQTILGAFAHCERSFLKEQYRRLTQGTWGSLMWKIRFTGFTLFALAMAEDWLNFYRAYESNIIQIETCNRTNVTLWENFYLREHPHVFHLVPFNVFTIGVTEWINRCMRYTWTYLDIFIISFSYGAQFRYEQIFRRLLATEGMACPINFWSELRMDYVAVSELVTFLDDHFGHLVLLACANDMYFIATQLFNGFQRRRAFANYIYFWYSLLLLIFRTVTMLYVGSGVYVASMRPLHLLRNISSKNWGIDLQRLTDEVSSGENVLSGKQFFFLKRQIILAMAGTLVTYELVLLDQVKKIPDTALDCSYF
ncbi:AGAP003256-PA-like protein [Anopheles sinensis]|uniref:Gustatory receptor n=1 Tax=Anopheles sinensis TaxID=74873 RepID=A0A084VUG5_ANOSI|nr:AGAP003256-PA-like protein [Anopheles sinensis]